MKWNRCKPLSDVGVYVGGPGDPVGGYVELRKWHRWKYRKRGRTYTVKRRGVALYLSPTEFHRRFQGMGKEFRCVDGTIEVKMNLFDQEDTYPNCTVQVLTNTVTGEQSVGWWQNEQ